MTKHSGSEQKLASYSNQFSQMGFDVFLGNINHLIWLVFVHLGKKKELMCIYACISVSSHWAM